MRSGSITELTYGLTRDDKRQYKGANQNGADEIIRFGERIVKGNQRIRSENNFRDRAGMLTEVSKPEM